MVERIVDAVLETDVRAYRRPGAGAVADTYCLELAGDPPNAVCKLAGASVWTGPGSPGRSVVGRNCGDSSGTGCGNSVSGFILPFPVLSPMDERRSVDRNWLAVSGLTVFAAIMTALVAAVDLGLLTAGFGAALAAVAVGGVGITAADRLSAAWAEHRPYVWFSVGLFTLGGLLGAALLAAGIDLTDLFLEILEEEFAADEEVPDDEFEIDISASFFIFQNTPPFLLSIFGVLTLGLLTFLVMFVNGVLVGNVALSMAGVAGIDFVIVALLPHGVFELPALFVAAGVGFRLLHRLGQRVLGTREAFVTREYLVQTGTLVLFAWLLLVVAAFVEAYLTPTLLEALFAARLE
ncbi:stage II sporulation protein M [Natrialbaceae archaeon A-gly3]